MYSDWLINRLFYNTVHKNYTTSWLYVWSLCLKIISDGEEIQFPVCQSQGKVSLRVPLDKKRQKNHRDLITRRGIPMLY